MNPVQIPFNKPFLTGKEPLYIVQAVYSGQISGNGPFTKKCHQLFEERYGFKKAFLTSSCTDALEMAALLIDTKNGDEIIVPSYTFVSTANAFLLRDARIVFADCLDNSPCIDADKIEDLITPKTKAIVVVHYAGVACDMDKIMDIADRHGLYVIEDAAHALESFYNGRPLGAIGHLATFSFHETKNVISGEGGLLAVNLESLTNRAEIIWEKGTNRAAFFRGEIAKYEWVDVGSSFLPSDLVAAFLYAQLEMVDAIQQRRTSVWNRYAIELAQIHEAGKAMLPVIPAYATVNGHLFSIVCHNRSERDNLVDYLRNRGIYAPFHYIPLHTSPYFADKHDGRQLPNADRFGNCLLRLPLFYEITDEEVTFVIEAVKSFFDSL